MCVCVWRKIEKQRNQKLKKWWKTDGVIIYIYIYIYIYELGNPFCDYIYICVCVSVCVEKNWKTKKSKLKKVMKDSQRYNVSVSINHNQDLEKMLWSVVKSSMDVYRKKKKRKRLYFVLYFVKHQSVIKRHLITSFLSPGYVWFWNWNVIMSTFSHTKFFTFGLFCCAVFLLHVEFFIIIYFHWPCG